MFTFNWLIGLNEGSAESDCPSVLKPIEYKNMDDDDDFGNGV